MFQNYFYFVYFKNMYQLCTSDILNNVCCAKYKKGMCIENKYVINLLLCRYYFYSGLILVILLTGVGVVVGVFVGVGETEVDIGEVEAEVEEF